MLAERLADAGDVAVPEDAEAPAEEALPHAVALDVLRARKRTSACAAVSLTADLSARTLRWLERSSSDARFVSETAR